MAKYVILKNLKGGERFPGELPSAQYLSVGDYVVFANRAGEERIGTVSVPDFDAEPEAVAKEWGKPCMVLAKLARWEMDWPEPKAEDFEIPEN